MWGWTLGSMWTDIKYGQMPRKTLRSDEKNGTSTCNTYCTQC